jgi:molybdopterin-guanine dinucleotide biosynthesis protein B
VAHIPIIAVVGFSGTGKTTLMEKLISELTERGLRVGTVKHHPHTIEMDQPGKDSWRHKRAGSRVAIISSPTRIGMVMEVDHDYRLDELSYFFSHVDIVLAEGYKRDNTPKIEVFRPEIHPNPICTGDEHLVALVSDVRVDLVVPRFSLGDIKGLADFLTNRFGLVPARDEQKG